MAEHVQPHACGSPHVPDELQLARATAIFPSTAGKRLGVLRIGPVGSAERNTLTGMIRKTATKSIPAQTRTIRVTLGASRTSGSYDDGYADNLSLAIGR